MKERSKFILLVLMFYCVLHAKIKTRLSPEEIKREEEKIRKILVDKTVYDVSVELKEVKGGYNIVIRNRAKEDSLRSFIDPTLIALILGAWHTRATNWKSETLKVWIRPHEGWGVLTKDCRIAETRSSTTWFYFLKTVDPYRFRKYIISKFFRLKSRKLVKMPPWSLFLLTGIISFLAGAVCMVFVIRKRKIFNWTSGNGSKNLEMSDNGFMKIQIGKLCRGLKKERFLMVKPYALLIDTGYLYQRKVVVFLFQTPIMRIFCLVQTILLIKNLSIFNWTFFIFDV